MPAHEAEVTENLWGNNGSREKNDLDTEFASVPTSDSESEINEAEIKDLDEKSSGLRLPLAYSKMLSVHGDTKKIVIENKPEELISIVSGGDSTVTIVDAKTEKTKTNSEELPREILRLGLPLGHSTSLLCNGYSVKESKMTKDEELVSEMLQLEEEQHSSELKGSRDDRGDSTKACHDSKEKITKVNHEELGEEMPGLTLTTDHTTVQVAFIDPGKELKETVIEKNVYELVQPVLEEKEIKESNINEEVPSQVVNLDSGRTIKMNENEVLAEGMLESEKEGNHLDFNHNLDNRSDSTSFVDSNEELNKAISPDVEIHGLSLLLSKAPSQDFHDDKEKGIIDGEKSKELAKEISETGDDKNPSYTNSNLCHVSNLKSCPTILNGDYRAQEPLLKRHPVNKNNEDLRLRLSESEDEDKNADSTSCAKTTDGLTVFDEMYNIAVRESLELGNTAQN